MGSRSVRIGSISDGLHIDEISRRIRDDHLSDSTVTVVLVGTDTWRRKHIDWEIAAIVGDTDANRRAGLVGILLPTHPSYGDDDYDPYTIPPRLHYNVECDFADLFDWSESPTEVAAWIHETYSKRRTVNSDNGSVGFRKNWKGRRWYPQPRGGEVG